MVNNSKKGPIYKLADATSAAERSDVTVATDSAIRDIENLEWDDADIAALFRALKNHHYRKSHSYPASNKYTPDVDVYVIHFDHKTMKEDKYSQKFYVKFAMNPSGKLLLIFSCHYSR
jgi:hypothetical protein